MISEVRNNRAYTKRDEELISDLSQENMGKVLVWISTNIYPRKTPLLTSSSYGLKHIMTSDIGIYVTNNQFKDAMLMCGFIPINENILNWNYYISKRSPCFFKWKLR